MIDGITIVKRSIDQNVIFHSNIFKFAFMGKFLQLYRFVPVVLLVLPPLDQPTLLDDLNLNPQPG